jgi:hypothetical protein
MITKQPVSFAFDCLCDFACTSNPLLNALVLIKYDAKIKNSFYELFGVEKRREKINRKIKLEKAEIKPAAAPALGNAFQIDVAGNDMDTRIIPRG